MRGKHYPPCNPRDYHAHERLLDDGITLKPPPSERNVGGRDIPFWPVAVGISLMGMSIVVFGILAAVLQ